MELLQPSGSSDPTFRHAQSMRSICLRLLKRFKFIPSDASVSGQELQEQQQQHQSLMPFRIYPPRVTNLIWALASLCAVADIPFTEPEARSVLQDLLCYTAHENEKSDMHALISTIHIVLNRLPPPSAAPLAPAAALEVPASVQDKCQAAHVLLNILSQVQHPFCFSLSLCAHSLQTPCDMGSKGLAQPLVFSAGSHGRGSPRRLVGPLADRQVRLFPR
jgi:hypothetical protein